MEIINTSLIRRASNQIACDMGGEVVILDLQSGTYYGLDVVGARIWELIERPASFEALRDAIMAEYAVDADTCSRDILAFVEEMRTAGLVELTNEAAA